jgi:ATP-dependent helicase HepA
MWIAGQRVMAELEPELGLGIIVKLVGPRLVEVFFPGAQLTRQYTQSGAPLRRLVLAPGQRVRSKDGKTHTIKVCHEARGLFRYESAEGAVFGEQELDHLIEDETPVAAFLMGHWSHPKTFRLRERAWALRAKSLDPDLRGLVGPRISLLPHQLSIASDVARREYPRLLLADEVGLGKTIEAGLIFSSLRALGRAKRVLIVVPESLEHQWLAEMYRRFHEMFTLVDAERSEQELLSQGKSAFELNQRVLCSIEFLSENVERLQEATEEPWDLLIVDEAHRLHWSEEEASVEWEIIQLLSERARGLLLLTATPQHHGIETQFGLLHLVDPKRYPDFATFRRQAEHLKTTAALATDIQHETRTAALTSRLKKEFPKDEDLAKAADAFEAGGPANDLLERLVDRHGTGRVLIRNRRSRIQGFPERKLSPVPIAPPKGWLEWLHSVDPDPLSGGKLFELAAGLGSKVPAKAEAEWFEARAKGLLALLDSLGKDKVLLIASTPERVEDLQEWLRGSSSVRTALFHEEMEIVERDRQAAWFAQADGARVLLCSEIGGEGRNFQFCHHLVLFDLPLHPDVVEQRIGRLDRIGQAEAVSIHVPFCSGTPEEVLLRWYSDGLDLFGQPWNGAELPPTLGKDLAEAFRACFPKSKSFDQREEILAKLMDKTKAAAEKIRTDQKESVDLLVDITSFNQGKGATLAERISQVDKASELKTFLADAFDHFGVEAESLDETGTLKLSAHSLTFVEQFPGLSGTGELLATFRRDLALVREELSFLSWEHPVTEGALDLVLQGNIGRVTGGFASTALNGEPVVLELLYVLQATAPASLEVEHDLPLRTLPVFITPEGKILEVAPEAASVRLKPISPHKAVEVLKPIRQELTEAFDGALNQAKKVSEPILKEAARTWNERFEKEKARLKELARHNALISDAEIEAHEKKREQGLAAITATEPRLDAIRLIIAGPGPGRSRG